MWRIALRLAAARSLVKEILRDESRFPPSSPSFSPSSSSSSSDSFVKFEIEHGQHWTEWTVHTYTHSLDVFLSEFFAKANRPLSQNSLLSFLSPSSLSLSSPSSLPSLSYLISEREKWIERHVEEVKVSHAVEMHPLLAGNEICEHTHQRPGPRIGELGEVQASVCEREREKIWK